MTDEPVVITTAEVIGRRLRRLRDDRRLSQIDVADLARTAGLTWTQETVARVETGRRDVSAGELVALGLALAVPPGDLLDPGGVRVRLGRSAAWLPGALVRRWADGDRHPAEGYVAADGAAPLHAAQADEDARRREVGWWADQTAEAEVHLALIRWAQAEEAAGRAVDQRRWKGKEAQLRQAHRKGNR
jgi:transcriptional regulator with XRE-family HTH domain